MKKFIIHYRLRSGITGRERITAANAWDATTAFLERHNLVFRDVAGILTKTAKI